jgi:hypothetical protein
LELRRDNRTTSHGTSPRRSNIAVGNNITVQPTPQMGRKAFMVRHQTVGPRRNRQNRVNEVFSPIARDPLPSYLFIPSCHASRTLFLTVNTSPQTCLFYTVIIAIFPSIILQCLRYSLNLRFPTPSVYVGQVQRCRESFRRIFDRPHD